MTNPVSRNALPEPNYSAEMRLPDGVTCDQCKFSRHCFGMGFTKPGNTSCDFWPNRFEARNNG